MRSLSVLVASSAVGCGTVLGEWFQGYQVAEGGDAGDGGEDAPASDGALRPPLDDCTPSFAVGNGITYPSQTTVEHMVVTDPQTDVLDTGTSCAADGGPPWCCLDDGSSRRPYCLVLAHDLRITASGRLGVTGARPLVLVTAGDILIDGTLDVTGTDGPSYPGPGMHPGSASAPGGGGGSTAEPGGGACGNAGGPAVAFGLVGGGNGGDAPPCRLAGAGGGAVQLVSLCGQILLSNTIDASGGGGLAPAVVDPSCPGGAGGGGGGTVWMEAASVSFGDGGTANINVSGGAGAGGSCQHDPASVWVPGAAASRTQPGAGADCTGGVRGGDGAAGATDMHPASGGTPDAGGTAAAGCGGGAGARGQVVIQVPGRKTCDGVPIYGGVCTVLPP
jgi:hypothetical protein